MRYGGSSPGEMGWRIGPRGSNGGGEIPTILQAVESTGWADGLDVGGKIKKGVMDHSKSFAPSNGKKGVEIYSESN